MNNLEIKRQEHNEEAKTLSYEAGVEQGESNLIRLQQILIDQNRIDDLQRSIVDPEYRKQLKTEFGLE